MAKVAFPEPTVTDPAPPSEPMRQSLALRTSPPLEMVRVPRPGELLKRWIPTATLLWSVEAFRVPAVPSMVTTPTPPSSPMVVVPAIWREAAVGDGERAGAGAKIRGAGDDSG